MSREALLAPCPKCEAVTLETDWDSIEHMTTPRTWRVDPTSITPNTETVCIITGRPTYGLYTRGSSYELGLRDALWHKWHHRGHPKHVLPAHQCDTSLPGTPLDLTRCVAAPIDPDAPIPF